MVTKKESAKKVPNKKAEPEFDLDNENRYLVAGFRAAHPGLGTDWKFNSSKELKEAFEKFKKRGADPK